MLPDITLDRVALACPDLSIGGKGTQQGDTAHLVFEDNSQERQAGAVLLQWDHGLVDGPQPVMVFIT